MIRCFENSSEGSLGPPLSLPLYLPGPGPGIPRRNCLPASHVHTSDVSLWNILRNNIGKDLSKVSMPVQLNEPLNTLQRLCEELEYSSLLDAASCSPDPCERLVSSLSFTPLLSSQNKMGDAVDRPENLSYFHCFLINA